MQVLGNLDIATLMSCIALACFLFAYAFFRLWGKHRSLYGSGSFALAFLAGAIASLLIPFGPASSAGIVFNDTLILVLYAFLLSGIERFFGVRSFSRLGWLLALLAFALNIYFTFAHPSMMARLLVNGCLTFLYRLTIGITVVRQKPRKHTSSLAALMFVFAAISLVGIWGIVTHPAPASAAQWLRTHGTESIGVFLHFAFVLATGQLLFLLLNGEFLNQVEAEATRDYLTGTLNRRAIERMLIAEMGRSSRFGLPLSIGLVDLDGFKQVNDTLGHAEGDRVLLLVSRSIQLSLRAYDTLGRFGGDEFLVILPNSSTAEALMVMERLRSEAALLSPESVTLSVGISSMLPKEPYTDLLARADRALYNAKQDGRNCTRVSLAQPTDLITAEAHLDVA